MSARASIFDGIKLNERQYEELISTRLNTEQIGRCNLPGRSRSNRIITAPARFYDYFLWELFDFGRLNRLNTAQ